VRTRVAPQLVNCPDKADACGHGFIEAIVNSVVEATEEEDKGGRGGEYSQAAEEPERPMIPHAYQMALLLKDFGGL
jgi:hypothetical protein